ncbi:hypothetical protein QBC35DRAFT_225196 [Podospora australis]|uniref:Mitochondrial pyruvate carrier n=1 Tax=Podospora australis TaxID=1536484 RepID=A0AAN7AMG0_9PEZI|nr:hypothetical protein QBC35DRAFT_225196 [Podospora australis]
MSPTSTLFRAARPAFRARTFFRPNQQPKNGARWQSTGGPGAGAAEAPESWAMKFWKSEKGPKTVHFWAPMMKWALVLAGISDFARPAESLSLTQNAALTTTGLIWTRWCLIIKPKNYFLAAVNFFLGIVGVVQCTRIAMYHQSVKKAEENETSKTETPALVNPVKPSP